MSCSLKAGKCLLPLALLGAASATVANPYVVTDIGLLPGCTSSVAYGVNDSGQVAGECQLTSGHLRAVLYSGGSLTDLTALTPPGSSSGGGLSINDSGDVVLWGGGAHKQGFVYTGGTMVELSQCGGVLNGLGNMAYSINNSGQVTGWYINSAQDQMFAFLYSGGINGTSTNVQPSNSVFYNTTGCGINNLGQVVGDGMLNNLVPPMPTYYPFVFTPGGGMQQVTMGTGTADAINQSGVVVGSTAQDAWHSPAQAFVSIPVAGGYLPVTLPSLGNGTTDGAYGISDTGVVVGESAGRAMIATESGSTWTTTDLNTLISATSGWTLQVAEAISNNGNYIVGNGTIAGQTHGFLLQAAMPGDANLDGTVDINDLTIVLAHYNQTGATWAQGEFTGNGTVDINDLTIVLAHYNQSLGAFGAGLAAVPEPSALVLIGFGAIGLLGFVWRRKHGA